MRTSLWVVVVGLMMAWGIVDKRDEDSETVGLMSMSNDESVIEIKSEEEARIVAWVLYHYRERKDDKNRINLERDFGERTVAGFASDMDSNANDGRRKKGSVGSGARSLVELRFAVWSYCLYLFGVACYYCWFRGVPWHSQYIANGGG